ncbi:MAG: LPS-assembly protein LptD [Rhodobacteraceae bacterium]|nr:LPS-assembly protein LptD [Paracoccaceae bacterium]
MDATQSLRRFLTATILTLLLTSPAASQERATLVADKLEIRDNSQLIAEGNVEVFFQGRRLTAKRIIYDQKAERLNIEGPIQFTDESGDTVVLASQADLSSDMIEGLLTSARVVLNRQLQMTATQAQRVSGRYLQLDNAFASSCRVCAGSKTPLWEIRARRITHDQTERQIYFDHAHLRLGGVPVFYIPYLRLPDPTLKRANGFLVPKFSSSTTLGTGIKLPYFLMLGASRDLTITPFLTTDKARSVTLRYRQAFTTGDITLLGALSGDTATRDLSSYVFADGAFRLPAGFGLTLHGETASGPAYLADYDISDTDRLTSSLDIMRVRRNELVYGSLKGIKSLRSKENASNIPSVIGDVLWQRRLTGFGGQGDLRFGHHGHMRSSVSNTDSDGDTVPDGRDVTRTSIGANWRRDWILPGGLIETILGETRLDVYDIAQDPRFAGGNSRLWGATGMELRWPLVRTDKNGTTQVLEPLLQVATAKASDAVLPKEDSTLVEFDKASLMLLNRYPGTDSVETGLHANIGLSWTRYDPDNWSLGTTLGRIIRAEDENDFSIASGLDGVTSDWLAAFHIDSGYGLYTAGRIIANDALHLAQSEVQMEYSTNRLALTSGYIWSIADAAEFRSENISEMVVSTGYELNDYWHLKASNRYDLTANEASRAGVGLRFKNECLLFDFSVSHRFTTSTRVQPDTRFGVTLELMGFGGGNSAGPTKMCRK